MKEEQKEDAHVAQDASWFERNVNLIIIGLVVACVITLLMQAVFTMFDEHHPPHFPAYENFFGFQAAFGFVAFVVVVFLGKLLRPIIRRKEDYYDA